MSDYCVVMTTAGTDDEAQRIARLLVEQRLAACVQVLPVTSTYRWQGAVEQSGELLLMVKTRTDRYADIEALVRREHSYETPEVVRVAIDAGSEPYLRWVDLTVS
jgi:periplasmic divalent cation tolerance protein